MLDHVKSFPKLLLQGWADIIFLITPVFSCGQKISLNVYEGVC